MHFYGKGTMYPMKVCVLRCLLVDLSVRSSLFFRQLVRLVFPLNSFLWFILITAVNDVKNELPCVINDKINLLQDEYVMPAKNVFLSLKGFSSRS